MEPVKVVSGKVSVLDRADVDTDQIIPKQFLKRVERTGFGEFLFYDWIRDGEIELEPNPMFRATVTFSSQNLAVAPALSTWMWGGSVPLAYAAQASVTVLAVALAVFVSRKGSIGNRSAAVMAAALLCTPYVLDYDLVVLTMAVAFLATDILRRGALRWEVTILAFAWIVPLFGRQVTGVTLIPLELTAIIAILALAVRRAILLDGALVFRSSPFRRSRAASAL